MNRDSVQLNLLHQRLSDLVILSTLLLYRNLVKGQDTFKHLYLTLNHRLILKRTFVVRQLLRSFLDSQQKQLVFPQTVL